MNISQEKIQTIDEFLLTWRQDTLNWYKERYEAFRASGEPCLQRWLFLAPFIKKGELSLDILENELDALIRDKRRHFLEAGEQAGKNANFTMLSVDKEGELVGFSSGQDGCCRVSTSGATLRGKDFFINVLPCPPLH